MPSSIRLWIILGRSVSAGNFDCKLAMLRATMLYRHRSSLESPLAQARHPRGHEANSCGGPPFRSDRVFAGPESTPDAGGRGDSRAVEPLERRFILLCVNVAPRLCRDSAHPWHNTTQRN